MPSLSSTTGGSNSSNNYVQQQILQHQSNNGFDDGNVEVSLEDIIPDLQLTQSGEIPMCGVISEEASNHSDDDNDDIQLTQSGASSKKSTRCPCCNRSKQPMKRGEGKRLETLNNSYDSSDANNNNKFKFQSLSLLDNGDDVESIDDDYSDDDDSCISEQTSDGGTRNPGKLDTNVHYTTKRTLAEGWVHKKGTGKDWMGSTDWKRRYARLVLANIPGYEVEVPVPLLLFYWFQSSETPSTAILLDSTVVVPFDKEDKTEWDAYSIDIIHAKKKHHSSVKRTLTVSSRKARDEWLFIISQALFNHEKQKAKVRQDATARPRSPPARFLMGSADNDNDDDDYPSSLSSPHHHPPSLSLRPSPTSPNFAATTKATTHTTTSTGDSIELEAHFAAVAVSSSSSSGASSSSPLPHQRRPKSPMPPSFGTPPLSPPRNRSLSPTFGSGGISMKHAPAAP